MSDQLKFRTEAIMLLLENGFDTQRVVEENPYGATKAIEDAFLVICDQADRIEALVKDRKFILDERDRTFALMLARAETAEAKLAKAMEALREIVSNQGYMDDPWSHAAATLAELEAKE